MTEILMKAGSFVAIIIMGYMLRRKGFFKEEDFYVLSRIVLKITLPAAIVTNFTGIDLKPSMLLMSCLLYTSMILLGRISRQRDRMRLPAWSGRSVP